MEEEKPAGLRAIVSAACVFEGGAWGVGAKALPGRLGARRGHDSVSRGTGRAASGVYACQCHPCARFLLQGCRLKATACWPAWV